MRRAHRLFALLPLLSAALLLSAAPTRAGIAFTSSQSAFASAYPGLSTQTFNSEPISYSGYGTVLGSTLNTSNDPRILPGLNFATPDGTQLFIVAKGGNHYINSNDNNTNQLLSTNSGSSVPIVTSFGLPQTAVSFTLLDSPYGTPPAGVVIDVFSTTGAFLANIGITPGIAGTGTFEGIYTTGNTTIGSIVLSQPFGGDNDLINIESVSFKAGIAPAAVPEPASLGLVTLGLVGVGLLRARTKRRPSIV